MRRKGLFQLVASPEVRTGTQSRDRSRDHGGTFHMGLPTTPCSACFVIPPRTTCRRGTEVVPSHESDLLPGQWRQATPQVIFQMTPACIQLAKSSEGPPRLEVLPIGTTVGYSLCRHCRDSLILRIRPTVACTLQVST